MKIRKAGSQVSTVIYAKAGHDWDSNRPREMGDKPYLTGCTIKFDDKAMPSVKGQALIPADAMTDRQTRYLLRLQSEKYLGDCVKVGYISGRDDATKNMAQKQLLQFLKTRFVY